MQAEAITRSYARWAPVYDLTFGAATRRGRRRAVRYLNQRGGSLLDVGVGTGLALPDYGHDLAVTGIDYSAEMLAKAREKVRAEGLSQVKALQCMDARQLDFPDNSFDTVAAMHVISVVPEPERVMAEMARVTRPGGEVVVVGHFARDRGALAWLERIAAPWENLLGWHSDFRLERVTGVPELALARRDSFPPFGMMTFLAFRKAG